ncbi:pirin-like bicupin family protein [uncultured Roseibium sp.]|uniref:pirin family protein n=1 Tax=uncultured Roseibium sp. TaxID=1936171 RepID=UPI00263827D3|nr:pirin-like bicupin family protein [uncultured Roseibium sp.]
MTLIHENMSRGHTRTGWLDSFHTFSFGNFRDPSRMGFGSLRVINEDRIIPGSGFAEHGHADMDILTLVLSGALRHKDTIGNEAIIAPGEVQLMSAGSGIRHSEMNASDTEPAHFLQIWLIPETQGGTPTYQQAFLPAPEAARTWSLVASGTPGEASLRLLSDTKISIVHPLAGAETGVPVSNGRKTYLHVVEGLATLAGERISSGDGLQVGREGIPALTWLTDGHALLFDMA